MGISNLFKDKISTALGFGTRKERLDYEIANYENETENAIKNRVANRNILISNIEIKLNTLNDVLDNYKRFLGYYDNIITLTEEEIKKGNSDIIFNLRARDGTIIATANYKALEDLIHAKRYANQVIFLVNQVEKMISNGKFIIINYIINGRGIFIVNNKRIDGREIYHNFLLAKQMLELNLLEDIGTSLNSFSQMQQIRETILVKKRELELVYDEFSIKLRALQQEENHDKYLLRTVEEKRDVMRSSKEYFEASSSHEYITRFRR